MFCTWSQTYNPAADLVLGQSTEETPKKPEGASKKRKHQEAEPAGAEETIQEDGDQEGQKKKKKKKSKDSEDSPVADADGGKKKKKKSKESEEPPVATAEGEKKEKKKKKKSDSQDAKDVAMETEASGKKDKKKKKKKHGDEWGIHWRKTILGSIGLKTRCSVKWNMPGLFHAC